MAQPQEFPFNIMDVAELLHLHIRRRQADSVYANCPICGDKRGKMNINFAKNLWRCNYCNEGGGMLSLYGKVYGISNSEAYRNRHCYYSNMPPYGIWYAAPEKHVLRS